MVRRSEFVTRLVDPCERPRAKRPQTRIATYAKSGYGFPSDGIASHRPKKSVRKAAMTSGWKTPTSGFRSFKKLPKNAQAYIKRIEEMTGVPVTIVSVGADREDTIILKNPFQ